MSVYFLVGNTSIKAAAGAGQAVFALADARAGLAGLLSGMAGKVAVAASVNPAGDAILFEACADAGLRRPLFARRDFPVKMRFDVENPEAVGVDRVLNVKAAYARARAASAAVDVGTAISVSVCVDDGTFAGGAILPGLEMSLAALARGTALLPNMCSETPASPLGRSTKAAMQSGVYYGAAGGVVEVVRRIEEALGKRLRVFLTGGGCPALSAALPEEWVGAPELTMEGLRLAYEESRG